MTRDSETEGRKQAHRGRLRFCGSELGVSIAVLDEASASCLLHDLQLCLGLLVGKVRSRVVVTLLPNGIVQGGVILHGFRALDHIAHKGPNDASRGADLSHLGYICVHCDHLVINVFDLKLGESFRFELK